MERTPRKPPEYPPEHAPEHVPEGTGTRWLTIAEVEQLLGKRERNARYWLERHKIPSHGERPKRFAEGAILEALADSGQLLRKAPERPPEHPPEYPPETTGTSAEYLPEGTGIPAEPIEAAYRVAGEAVAEVALVPLQTMVGELRGLADQLAELARRNEGLALEVGTLRGQAAAHAAQLAAKDQTIATQAEALAELRRRAEVAEAAQAAAAAQEGLGAPEAAAAVGDAPVGRWGRLRRWWQG